MPNIDELFPSRFFKACHVESPKLLVISEVKIEEVGDEHKPVIYFNGEKMGLVLNKVNSGVVKEIASGVGDIDLWPGLAVVLYADRTPFGGKMVDCIRVRPPKGEAAEANKKWLAKVNDQDFAAQVAASEGEDSLPF